MTIVYRPELYQLQIRFILALHDYFQQQGFIHITTPHLQAYPPFESHIYPFSTEYHSLKDSVPVMRYLHASPELAMKKAIAQGIGNCYQIARVYRNKEDSPLHKAEFFLLEWYRIDAALESLCIDCQEIGKKALHVTQNTAFRYHDRSCVASPYRRQSVRDVFIEYCGIDLASTLRPQPPYGDRDALRRQARLIGVDGGDDLDWQDWFHLVFLAHIDGELGRNKPFFLTSYPRPLAMLAEPCSSDPRFSQRMELFLCGIEIANAYQECAGYEENRDALQASGRVPIDEDFLSMLKQHPLPRCCGCALGLDRLLMLACHAPTIHHVP